MIDVSNVSKSYFRDSLEIPVLRNISLSIPAESSSLSWVRPDPENRHC